jgi:hypothetical protein
MGQIFLRRETTSQHHRYTEEAEKTLSNVNATDLLGPFAGEVEAGARKVVSSNLLEDTGLPLIKVKLGNGGNVVGKRVGVQKLDDAVGVGMGERLE